MVVNKRSNKVALRILIKPKTLKTLKEYAKSRRARSIGGALDMLIEYAGDIVN